MSKRKSKTLVEVFAEEARTRPWTLLSVKIPPELRAALDKQGGNVPLFVRQTLATALGVEYQERKPGLAGATPSVRKLVSRAGVTARANNSP